MALEEKIGNLFPLKHNILHCLDSTLYHAIISLYCDLIHLYAVLLSHLVTEISISVQVGAYRSVWVPI